MNGQSIEVVDKFNYLGVFLKNTEGWSKQKTLANAKGYAAFLATANCVLVLLLCRQ
jgi:hypothetical protein